MVITKIALPRRTFIRGMGAVVALPFLDAMVPALSAMSKAAPRFAAVYVGNGVNPFDWVPDAQGKGFAFSPTLKPLEAFRDHTLVLSGELDVGVAEELETAIISCANAAALTLDLSQLSFMDSPGSR